MLDHIPETVDRWRNRSISAPAAAALYFLYWQIHLHGAQFASRRFKGDARPQGQLWLEMLTNLDGIELDQWLIQCFSRYQFKGVIGVVPLAMSEWLKGEWPLELMLHIPSPTEVLAMQVKGSRPVTLVVGESRMLRPVLTKTNGFQFLVHDLEHAHKFFADPVLHDSQRLLFAKLAEATDAPWLTDFLTDSVFRQKFEYLISDMNTHPMHSLLYLRAILVEAYLKREGKCVTEALSPGAWKEIKDFVASIMPELTLPDATPNH
jgi:hypothetical protein